MPRQGRRIGLCGLLGLLAWPMQGQAGAPVAAPATASSAASGASGSTGVAVASATSPDAAPNSRTASALAKSPAAVLQAQIAKLPLLTGTDINVPKRSTEIMNHLSAVLRFYRAAVLPVQKVGEPSDVLYAEQSSSEATQTAGLAFQAAKNEAALLSRVPSTASAPKPKSAAGTQAAQATQGTQGAQGDAQRLNSVLAQAQARVTALEEQQAALQTQISTAHAAQRADLQQQEQQVEGGLELQKAMVEALGRISSFSEAQSSTGLAGDIDRLQRSAPELLNAGVKASAPPLLQSLAEAHNAGVTTQAEVMFALLSSLRDIDQQISANDALAKQAEDLRTPFPEGVAIDRAAGSGAFAADRRSCRDAHNECAGPGEHSQAV